MAQMLNEAVHQLRHPDISFWHGHTRRAGVSLNGSKKLPAVVGRPRRACQ